MNFPLLFPALLGLAFGNLLSMDERIINGFPATNGQFPYIVSIRKFGIHFCSGSIISKRWVLSAAHCHISADFFTRILAGTVSQSSGGHSYRISEAITHEDYDRNTHKNDIALLLTKKEFHFDELIKPVKIAIAKSGEMHTAVGWGMMNTEIQKFPTVLQYVSLQLVSLRECQKLYKSAKHQKLTPGKDQVCTFDRKGAGTCAGDSGGPLISKAGDLVGILSYGPTKPCGKTLPDVYTKAYSYSSWIKKHTEDY